MKCLESIVKKHICKYVENLCDDMQFAYKQNRCVDDAVTTMIHILCSHLDKCKTYSRVLFVDFSSAFNTIQPHLMMRKLFDMNVNSNLVAWIHSYLTLRPQYVKLNGAISDCIVTNTGAPQGCVLSPLLFTLYTNDCTSKYENCSVLKYADDTVIIGNISNNNETQYMLEVNEFVKWCDVNYLNLNVKKTMEMFVDFRKDRNEYETLSIKNEDVKVVRSYKHLGVYIDDQLNFSENAQYLFKKGIQRIHFLRLLNNMNVDKQIMSLFYRSIVESVMSYCIISWFGSSHKKDQHKLAKIGKIAKRMGVNSKNLNELYQNDCINMVDKILKDAHHPLYNCYVLLRSGRRLNVHMQRTSRLRNTFVPSSINLCNRKLKK